MIDIKNFVSFFSFRRALVDCNFLAYKWSIFRTRRHFVEQKAKLFGKKVANPFFRSLYVSAKLRTKGYSIYYSGLLFAFTFRISTTFTCSKFSKTSRNSGSSKCKAVFETLVDFDINFLPKANLSVFTRHYLSQMARNFISKSTFRKTTKTKKLDESSVKPFADCETFAS